MMQPHAVGTVRANTSVVYDVVCQRGLLGNVVEMVGQLDSVRSIVVVTDKNVGPLYATTLASRLKEAGYSVLTYAIEPHRTQKSLESAAAIFRAMFEHGADRDALVLNVGGGTVGDLGGFVAALYLRGIRYVHLPTTLVSQAESGIGGKVSVNFNEHVNSLSVFHHPFLVWIDPSVLGTLPDPEFRSGLAEIVKYSVVLDPVLLEFLEGHVDAVLSRDEDVVDEMIRRCLDQKCAIVSTDPQERGRFRLFNYGHEIGHAVEVAYGYDALRHGEAVSIGMHASAWLGTNAGITDSSLNRRQRDLLTRFGLPVEIPSALLRRFRVDELSQTIRQLLWKDKKRSHARLVWIIPVSVGEAICTDAVDAGLVAECVSRLAAGDPLELASN